MGPTAAIGLGPEATGRDVPLAGKKKDKMGKKGKASFGSRLPLSLAQERCFDQKNPSSFGD